MKTALVLLLLIITPLTRTFSQEGIGINPPELKWRQISTPAGRIIFPKGMDSLAFRTAGLVNYQRLHDSSIAGPQVTQKVSQIIQNQSVLPAGFSTPAPWRNEYYVTPPANMFLGPISWTDAMELHEYRHAQQFSMANQGWTWPYKVVMGQTGWLLSSLMTQPLWFREGDAVLAETIFTHGGRGRLPSFHMEYRAMRLAGYHYSYEKAHYTSLRDFVPNPYRIGYYMVTKARRDYGNKFWNSILRDTYRRKALIYPFTRSMKDHTGSGTRGFYNRTVRELDSLWSAQDKALAITASTRVSQPKGKKYTNYRFPQYLDDGSILVMKSSFDLINTYYIITPDGKEKELFSPGRYTDDHITLVAENNKMVWAESAFHERYINKDYSIIKLHDLTTGKTQKLTARTRYFSPAVSPDGKKVFVTETDYQNNYFHLILDATSGAVLKRSPNPEGIFLTHPRWMDDVHMVCVAVSTQGNAIVRLNTGTQEMSVVVPYTYAPVSRPFPQGDYIYFSAGHTGINNIYASNITTGDIFQVTSVRFGAFEPVVSDDSKKLFYSEYTADGYRIQKIDITPETWRPIDGTEENDLDFFLNRLSTEEDRAITDSTYTSSDYKVKKFNAFTNGLFNFYGWLVLPNTPEYGVEVYTQNIMSTLRGTVGALYNTNENRFHYYARATYAALYPILELEYQTGNRHTALITNNDPAQEPFNQLWKEDFISGGIRLPFRLTQGTHNTNLTVQGRYETFTIDFLDSADSKNVLASEEFDAIRTNLTFSRSRLQAIQHFRPRWGQFVEAEYRQATEETAQRIQASVQLYFPGFFRTHSFNTRGVYKDENVVNAYRFTDNFQMPRGYRPFPFTEVTMGSVNYELPIMYPDLSVSGLLFLQRLRTNFFYDHAIGRLTNREITMKSPGAELYADLRLFRLFQMTLCFRYAFVEDATTGPSPERVPFQFLVTRFELLN